MKKQYVCCGTCRHMRRIWVGSWWEGMCMNDDAWDRDREDFNAWETIVDSRPEDGYPVYSEIGYMTRCQGRGYERGKPDDPYMPEERQKSKEEWKERKCLSGQGVEPRM